MISSSFVSYAVILLSFQINISYRSISVNIAFRGSVRLRKLFKILQDQGGEAIRIPVADEAVAQHEDYVRQSPEDAVAWKRFLFKDIQHGMKPSGEQFFGQCALL